MKQFINNLTLFVVFISFVVLQSCDDTLNSDIIDNTVIPSSNVSYREHLQPVLDLKCNNSSCHEDQTRAGGLSFTTWANTRADISVVFPTQPDNSKLIWSIESQSGSSQMPPLGYAALTKNQREGFRTWIAEGAKNN